MLPAGAARGASDRVARPVTRFLVSAESESGRAGSGLRPSKVAGSESLRPDNLKESACTVPWVLLLPQPVIQVFISAGGAALCG